MVIGEATEIPGVDTVQMRVRRSCWGLGEVAEVLGKLFLVVGECLGWPASGQRGLEKKKGRQRFVSQMGLRNKDRSRENRDSSLALRKKRG